MSITCKAGRYALVSFFRMHTHTAYAVSSTSLYTMVANPEAEAERRCASTRTRSWANWVLWRISQFTCLKEKGKTSDDMFLQCGESTRNRPNDNVLVVLWCLWCFHVIWSHVKVPIFRCDLICSYYWTLEICTVKCTSSVMVQLRKNLFNEYHHSADNYSLQGNRECRLSCNR